jgi:uncharacterized protein (TIGR02284 family)
LLLTHRAQEGRVFNDLIEINNDRIADLKKHLQILTMKTLTSKRFFKTMPHKGVSSVRELTATVAKTGDDPETYSSCTSSFHQPGSMLNRYLWAEAERGEDAIKKAYETALLDKIWSSFQ